MSLLVYFSLTISADGLIQLKYLLGIWIMTKLEILKSYPSSRIRDTWFVLGENTCTSSTRIYNKDLIYKVIDPLSDLEGCLIYCKEELIGTVDWAKADLCDLETGEITFGNSIISPFFRLVLLKEDLESIIMPPDPEFSPYQEYYQRTDIIQIPDDEYDLILSEIGYPFITGEELEYSREQITKLAIKPALEEYFKWIPKAMTKVYPINSKKRTEEFPTDAYDVLHWSVQQAGAAGTGSTTNTLLRFVDETVIGNAGTAGMIAGLSQGYSAVGPWTLQRAATQGIINYTTRTYFDIVKNSEGKKCIEFYSTKTGELNVVYAMKSWRWDDIEYARLPEVREFAAANVKLLFANLRTQAKSNIPGSIDYSNWITSANSTKERIRKDWMSLVKISSVIRGGL